MDRANGSLLTRLQQALRSDLDFHGSNSRHHSHGWHPFPAKFPPQLPQFFIERLSAKDDVVLDPMCGSGTSLLEAACLGRRAIGCDIDPLAQFIAQSKFVALNGVQTLQIGRQIIDEAKRELCHRTDQLRRELKQRFNTKTRAFIDYWFLPAQQLELLALLRQIESLPQEELRTFFKIVFSSTIIAKSGGVSLARDLAHTRPHRVGSKKPASGLAEFEKHMERNLASCVDGLNVLHRAEIRPARADDTGLPSSSVDMIITSPPYANNAIDYMRAHKFSLVWFGWKIEELSQMRRRYLGHETGGNTHFNRLPTQCENTLARLTELDPLRAAALRRYFGEMSAVLREMQRVLRTGKPVVIVVGSSTLRGLDVETQKGLAAIGQSVGLNLAGIGVRQLDRDKRMMPARWNKEPRTSQIEKRVHKEYVIGWLKA